MKWPKFIAHRGASAISPENTMESLELAIALGAKAVEFDVQPSRDNILMLFHDANLLRCNKSSQQIFDLSAAQLQHMEAVYQFGHQSPLIHIPIFNDYLSMLESSNIYFNCELKCHAKLSQKHTADYIQPFLKRLEKQKQRCLITSSCKKCLAIMASLTNCLNLGLITRKIHPSDLRLINTLNLRSISVNYQKLTYHQIQQLQQNNTSIMVFTVNNYVLAQQQIPRGINRIFSDIIFT